MYVRVSIVAQYEMGRLTVDPGKTEIYSTVVVLAHEGVGCKARQGECLIAKVGSDPVVGEAPRQLHEHLRTPRTRRVPRRSAALRFHIEALPY